MVSPKPSIREAVNYVKGYIGRFLESSNIDFSITNLIMFYNSEISGVKVDDRYIYIGFLQGNIEILNRWTRECIKKIDRPDLFTP